MREIYEAICELLAGGAVIWFVWYVITSGGIY